MHLGHSSKKRDSICKSPRKRKDSLLFTKGSGVGGESPKMSPSNRKSIACFPTSPNMSPTNRKSMACFPTSPQKAETDFF